MADEYEESVDVEYLNCTYIISQHVQVSVESTMWASCVCTFKHVCTLVPRLQFLQHVISSWATSIGLPKLRKDPAHNLVGEASADPTDDTVASLATPLELILANFGKDIPVGSKFKAF